MGTRHLSVHGGFIQGDHPSMSVDGGALDEFHQESTMEEAETPAVEADTAVVEVESSIEDVENADDDSDDSGEEV